MEEKILFINRADYLLADFCREFFQGSELIDGCVLLCENKKYDLIRCEPVGMQLHRDIEMYRLSECQ